MCCCLAASLATVPANQRRKLSQCCLCVLVSERARDPVASQARPRRCLRAVSDYLSTANLANEALSFLPLLLFISSKEMAKVLVALDIFLFYNLC